MKVSWEVTVVIIKALLSLITGLISMIPFSIPSLPSQVGDVFHTLLGYLNDGIGFLSNFVHMEYIGVLFGIFVGIEAALLVYKFVMWIIKKIPMLGVQD